MLQSLLWRSVKLNLPIKDLTKFVKFLHNSGCNLAAYDEKKLVTHEAKIIQATFQDSTLLHWLGEYPMLTITYDSENSFLLTAKFAWPHWGEEWLAWPHRGPLARCPPRSPLGPQVFRGR